MSVQSAIDCLRSIDRLGLKEALYHCETESALFTCLDENGFSFEKFEFEEALRTLDVNCQFSDNIEELRQNADWFRVLVEDA